MLPEGPLTEWERGASLLQRPVDLDGVEFAPQQLVELVGREPGLALGPLGDGTTYRGGRQLRDDLVEERHLGQFVGAGTPRLAATDFRVSIV